MHGPHVGASRRAGPLERRLTPANVGQQRPWQLVDWLQGSWWPVLGNSAKFSTNAITHYDSQIHRAKSHMTGPPIA